MLDLHLGGQVITDVSLVVFDKDGTLIDLYRYWGRMVRLRAEAIADRLGLNSHHVAGLVYAMGVDEAHGCLRPEGPVGILPRSVVMEAAAGYLRACGYPESADTCESAFAEVDAYSLTNLGSMLVPLPQAQQLLEDIVSAGGKCAIATTDRSDRAQAAIAHLGLTRFFHCIAGTDCVERTKPAPDMLQFISRKVSIPLRRTVMVGDAITDVQMGRNAGVRASIGVASGLTPAASLREVADYVVEGVWEIAAVGRDERGS